MEIREFAFSQTGLRGLREHSKDVDMQLSRKQMLSSGKQRLPGTVIVMK